jgi:hypothetical protein
LPIPSPFFPVGRSGRNNAYDLDRLAVLVVIPDRMGDQEEQMPLQDSKSLPALFATLNATLIGKSEWVGKYSCGNIKTDPVRAPLMAALAWSQSNRVYEDRPTATNY